MERTCNNSFIHYLFYDGSLLDIGINYTMLLISSMVMILPWRKNWQNRRLLKLLLFVFLCAGLQALVWWAADAFGISLVWCGQQGFIYLNFINTLRKPKQERLGPELLCNGGAGCLGIAAISYYAIFFPLITTIAHLSALFVGTILGSILLATENMKICQGKEG